MPTVTRKAKLPVILIAIVAVVAIAVIQVLIQKAQDHRREQMIQRIIQQVDSALQGKEVQ